jgi:non-homologous end joining protein Ku
MPRSIWSGAISFGLVNAPVRMYSAISEHAPVPIVEAGKPTGPDESKGHERMTEVFRQG